MTNNNYKGSSKRSGLVNFPSRNWYAVLIKDYKSIPKEKEVQRNMKAPSTEEIWFTSLLSKLSQFSKKIPHPI